MVFDIFSYKNGDVELLHAGLTPMETLTAVRCNVNSDKDMQRDTVYQVKSIDGTLNAYVSAISPDGDNARKLNNHTVISIDRFVLWLYYSVDIRDVVEDMCNDTEYFYFHNANLSKRQSLIIDRIRDNLRFVLNKLDNLLED